MTYAPAKLLELQTYWKAHGGVSLGIVGDANHQAKGTSYHLGADDLLSTAYSVKTARDKAGLTNAASAIDLGKLNGSFPQLRKFSTWLYDQARKNAPGTRDFREIIWSPDGKVVLRWDRERGYTSGAKPGEASTSHLYHTHVSWYRDAQSRDHTVAFRPYFETAPQPGGDMPTPSQYLPGYNATIKATSNIRQSPTVNGTLIRNITSPETWGDILGFVKGGQDVDGSCSTDQWLTRWHGGQWEYTSKCNVTSGPTADSGAANPTTCKPYTDPLHAEIAALEKEVETAHLEGAQDEWDRQNIGATVDVVLLPKPTK